MANFHLELQARESRENLSIRAEHPDLVHDVFYNDLMNDPVTVMRDIYRRIDLPWTSDHEVRITAYLKDHPQHKHGKHNYSTNEFGQSSEQIFKSFEAYLDVFGARLEL